MARICHTRPMFWNRPAPPAQRLVEEVARLGVELARLKRLVDELDEDTARRFKKMGARNGRSDPAPSAVESPVSPRVRALLERRARRGHAVLPPTVADDGRLGQDQAE